MVRGYNIFVRITDQPASNVRNINPFTKVFSNARFNHWPVKDVSNARFNHWPTKEFINARFNHWPAKEFINARFNHWPAKEFSNARFIHWPAKDRGRDGRRRSHARAEQSPGHNFEREIVAEDVSEDALKGHHNL
jgi:hypothetical protein